MSSLRQFGKETLIYSGGNLLIRFVSFMLVPVYTNIFTQQEFGTYSLIFTFIGLLQIFYNYGMASVLMKFHSQDAERKKTVITTAFLSLFITSLIFSSLLWMFSRPLCQILFSTDEPRWMMAIAGILFLDTISVRAMVLLRFENRPVLFTAVALTNVLVSLGSNVYLVYHLHMGITGAIYATLISSGVSFALMAPFVMRYIRFKNWSRPLLKEMLSFGLPFLPAAIFQIIMDLADRYLIDWIAGREMVGLYNAGYKLGSLMLILATGFNLGWQPFFLKKERDPDAPEIFSRISLFVIGGFSTVWVMFILFGRNIVRFGVGGYHLIGPDFWSAASVIPIVMAGYLFLIFYDLFMPGIFYSGRSGLLSIYRAAGAVSNILLNLLMIPVWGIHGAAWATCISFGVMTVPLYVKTQKLFYVPWPWRKLGIILVTGAILFIVDQMFHPEFLMRTLLFVLDIFVVAAVVMFPRWRRR